MESGRGRFIAKLQEFETPKKESDELKGLIGTYEEAVCSLGLLSRLVGYPGWGES